MVDRRYDVPARRPRRSRRGALMGLFDIFRRKPPIARSRRRWPTSSTAMPPFWCRKASTNIPARAPGTTPRCCSANPSFQDAVEALALARLSARACHGRREWRKALLRPHAGDDRRAALDALTRRSCSSVFDRYPVSPAVGDAGLERGARATLHTLAARRPASAASAPWTSRSNSRKSYFDLMPIHEKLRGARFPTIAQLSARHDLQHP